MTNFTDSNEWDWLQSQLLPLQPFAVFCGAGISRLSGLPIVIDVVPAILRRLGADQPTIDAVSELPFEAVIDVLAQHGSIKELLAIYKAGAPNANHEFIANLMASRITTDVCTTNFDLLIETASNSIGLRQDVDYHVFKNVAGLKEANWTSNEVRLVKIHGCASDTEGMAITIRQVATRVIDDAKRVAIQHFFATGPHRAVLVLGYSCSDVFDLSPLIMEAAPSGKPVFLIEHTTGPGLKVEPLEHLEVKNPFREFRSGYRVFVDTNLLVQFLWTRLKLRAAYHSPAATTVDWGAALDRWSGSITSAEVPQIRAHLNYLAGMHSEALSEYGKITDTGGDARQRALALSNQVPVLLSAGQPQRAYDVCQMAIAQFRRMPEMLPSLGNTLGWLGNCLIDLGRLEEALEQYEHSIQILSLFDDKRGIGNQHGNIANALNRMGRHDEALENYKIALAIADEMGNVKGVINQHVGISVALLEKKEFAAALEWATKGATIASDFGDRQWTTYLRSLAEEASNSLRD